MTVYETGRQTEPLKVNPWRVERTINHYGAEAQQIVAVEELSELTKEITKMLRGMGDKEHMTEEIADVLIIIENLQQIHNIPDEKIQAFINAKQERNERRMKWKSK